jgi:hypothetical protein
MSFRLQRSHHGRERLHDRVRVRVQIKKIGRICVHSVKLWEVARKGDCHQYWRISHIQDGRLSIYNLARVLEPMLTLKRRQEIMDLVADAEADTTDSPEIGPPPVSQFVDEDPVKIALPKKGRNEDKEDLSGLDPSLSINLEQRRKRKDSAGPSEAKRSSKVEAQLGVREAAGSLKTGAKRKLSVRDDEEHEAPAQPRSPDDFKFTRVASEDRTKSTQVPSDKSGRVSRDLAVARGALREKLSTTTAPTNRKVLAPKSVNDSPRKTGKALVLDEIKAAKAESQKPIGTKERLRERKQEPLQIQPATEALIRTVEVQPEPETPAAPDIFSPSSSQPSTARAESRDTPPPPDLGPGTEGQRPSRRARGGVSYAEPNLRDKMRRPTKELVDAVARDDKVNRGSFVKLEEDTAPTTVKIKAEPDANDDWKQMAVASSATVENSPLSSKAPDSLPNSITTHRKRRESLLNSDSDLPRSSSGSAIAALLAENRKAKAAAKEKQRVLDNEAAVTKAMEKLDIYEFKSSSPEEVPAKEIREEKAASRLSRRHSSIPRDIASLTDSEASDMEAPRKQEGSMSRRRQSTLSLRSSSTSTEAVKVQEPEKTLKKSISTSGMADSGTGGLRTDRMSARRRSMML